MSNIKFRMAARCEAAGRTDNEDNYQLSDNLSEGNWGFSADKEILLGNNGALIIVCDGMGGMNAGEIASALAVKTIQQNFSSDKLNEVVSSPVTIKKHIEKSIIAADTAIKDAGRADAEKLGMGTTVVLAWIVDNKVYVGWCGDSRAYRYNPVDGLVQLSHDHSYVQELVDAGKLSEELAFDHPNSNVITRSLGDPNRTARPDVKEYLLRNDDVIMLCSDGLCGVLRDSEIESVMKNNHETMAGCRDALWEAARQAEWHDNVTIGLCQVLSGAEKQETSAILADQPPPAGARISKRLIIILAAVIAILLGVIIYLVLPEKSSTEELSDSKNISQIDSLLKKYEPATIDLTTWENDKLQIASLCEQLTDSLERKKYQDKLIAVTEKVLKEQTLPPQEETIADATEPEVIIGNENPTETTYQDVGEAVHFTVYDIDLSATQIVKAFNEKYKTAEGINIKNAQEFVNANKDKFIFDKKKNGSYLKDKTTFVVKKEQPKPKQDTGQDPKGPGSGTGTGQDPDPKGSEPPDSLKQGTDTETKKELEEDKNHPVPLVPAADQPK